MPATFSGKALIAILMKEYGFLVFGQKGSHIKLKRITREETIVTIVPLHRELAHGTMRGVLRRARIEYLDFLEKARK